VYIVGQAQISMTGSRLVQRRPAARARRLLATALLLHYAMATWIIPVAHAALSDHRTLAPVHIEQRGNRDCQPVHNHANCLGFGVARLLAAAPHPVRIPDGSHAGAFVRLPKLEGRPLRATLAALGPRAPPLA
jgi:hypothetical protein